MPTKVTPADTTALAPVPPVRASRPAVDAPPFAAHLASAEERRAHADVHRLYQGVEAAGRQLKENPDEQRLARYRQAVREYLREVLPRAYRLKAHVSQRDLSLLVEEIDAELAALTQELLAGQRAVLVLASRIDRVNGILLDLRT